MLEAGSATKNHTVITAIIRSIWRKGLQPLLSYANQQYTSDNIVEHITYVLGAATAMMRDLKTRLMAIPKVTNDKIIFDNSTLLTS